MDGAGLVVSIIFFLLIATVLLVVGILVFIYSRRYPAGSSCINTIDCTPGQVCITNQCTVVPCQTDTDCVEDSRCINQVCQLRTCHSGNDCPAGLACTQGRCVRIGGQCDSNLGCSGLSCMNGRCVDCTASDQCPTGQGCFSGICRYPQTGDNLEGLITYLSPSQNRGDIAAPPGYFCTVNQCGNQDFDPIPCATATQCPDSCSSCVNGVCRCIKGDLYESCTVNTDCKSDNCIDSDLGRVCGFAGGSDCLFNYNGLNDVNGVTPANCPDCCPSTTPYCVNGACAIASDDALCGYQNARSDICFNTGTGEPNAAPDGMGYFCVDGRCTNTPGFYNQQCTPGSCQALGLSCNQDGRCQPLLTD